VRCADGPRFFKPVAEHIPEVLAKSPLVQCICGLNGAADEENTKTDLSELCHC